VAFWVCWSVGHGSGRQELVCVAVAAHRWNSTTVYLIFLACLTLVFPEYYMKKKG